MRTVQLGNNIQFITAAVLFQSHQETEANKVALDVY